jgi:hypothetical protein
MIEEVEKLNANGKRGGFPARNFGTLHDCEISIEILRPAKTIAALTEGHGWAVADAHGS